MPRRQLFLRTKRTMTANSGDGRYTVGSEGWPQITGTGWVDAFERYGVSLESGAITKLMTPAPQKTPANNSSAGSHGVAYGGSTIGKKDERQFDVDIHICASSEADFLTKYALFCNEILDCGYFQLVTSWEPTKVYHLLYRYCDTLHQFFSGMGKYQLAVTEPHPEIHDDRQTGFSNTTV